MLSVLLVAAVFAGAGLVLHQLGHRLPWARAGAAGAGAVALLVVAAGIADPPQPTSDAPDPATVSQPANARPTNARPTNAQPTQVKPTEPPTTAAQPTPPPPAGAPPPTTAPALRSEPPAAVLLVAAPGGDGDSWRDTQGREYRLGMVNAPEVGECWAEQATAERRRLVADGFTARTYTRDDYGRGVSVVTSASGVDVGVHLARHGFVDDRYLAQFRHEDPALARRLDAAFAAAKRERRGLWGACAAEQAPAPQPLVPQQSGADCHPSYETCIPVKGDGSGRGEANDLDCGDIGHAVRLRRAGDDPYRLDRDGDLVACE